MSRMFLGGLTLGMWAGELNVTNDWNQIFPDYKFTDARQFLTEAWQGKS